MKIRTFDRSPFHKYTLKNMFLTTSLRKDSFYDNFLVKKLKYAKGSLEGLGDQMKSVGGQARSAVERDMISVMRWSLVTGLGN